SHIIPTLLIVDSGGSVILRPQPKDDCQRRSVPSMAELNEAPHATSAPMQRRSGLSARFVAAQAAAAVAIVVVTVAVMQGLSPAAATAQATPNRPVVATTATAETARSSQAEGEY